MTIDILTIFPEMFESVLNSSILGRAREKGLICVETTDIRPFSAAKHKNTDDYPFGGGAGMLMMAQPIADAIKAVCQKRGLPCVSNVQLASEENDAHVSAQQRDDNQGGGWRRIREYMPETPQGDAAVEGAANAELSPKNEDNIPNARMLRVYLSPRGVPLTQKLAQILAREENLLLLCGHYEGVDQRVLDKYIDLEISVGDYVLTGGELGAMVLTDCIARLIPGVLGSEESPQDESFSADGLLEYPQYTRPRVFEGMEVPAVLLNGDHAKIAAWRREQAMAETKKRRPDLWEKKNKK